jgi:hypothetical protein
MYHDQTMVEEVWRSFSFYFHILCSSISQFISLLKKRISSFVRFLANLCQVFFVCVKYSENFVLRFLYCL